MVGRHARASWAIAWRLLYKMLRNPAFLLPSMLMPIFFFTAFAGGLVAVSDSPGFDYPSYTTFQYVFVLMQSAVFGGGPSWIRSPMYAPMSVNMTPIALMTT